MMIANYVGCYGKNLLGLFSVFLFVFKKSLLFGAFLICLKPCSPLVLPGHRPVVSGPAT